MEKKYVSIPIPCPWFWGKFFGVGILTWFFVLGLQFFLTGFEPKDYLVYLLIDSASMFALVAMAGYYMLHNVIREKPLTSEIKLKIKKERSDKEC